MLSKVLTSAFSAIGETLLKAWQAMTQRKEDVAKGAEAVKKEQLEHENEILKDAIDIVKDVHAASDDDIDDGLRRPSDS